MTKPVCAQLGYQDFFGNNTIVTIVCMKYTQSVIGMVRGSPQSGAGKFITLSECNEPGLTGCIETPSDDNCTECSLVFLQCIAG